MEQTNRGVGQGRPKSRWHIVSTSARPDAAKCFTSFASFHFMAVLQVSNYDPCFRAAETEAKKKSSDFPRVTPLSGNGAGIYARSTSNASPLSLHQRKSKVPLIENMGQAGQVESGRSPGECRMCLQPGELASRYALLLAEEGKENCSYKFS